MPTNQDYFERWEQSAPTPVAGTLTPEEIAKHQGTRLRPEGGWWESYGKELGADDPALLEAIAEYAGRVSDALAVCAHIWASLPGAGYAGQTGGHTRDQLVGYFKTRLATY